jgi:hypothetical protein
MYYLNHEFSLCSKEQRENIFQKTEYPLIYVVENLFDGHFSEAQLSCIENNKPWISNNLIEGVEDAFVKFSNHPDVQRGLLFPTFFKAFLNKDIQSLKGNKSCNVYHYVVSERNMKIIIENPIENTISSIPKKENVFYFSPEIKISRVAFKDFCENAGIEYKITRDPKKATIIIQNVKEQELFFKVNYAFPEQEHFMQILNLDGNPIPIRTYMFNKYFKTFNESIKTIQKLIKNFKNILEIYQNNLKISEVTYEFRSKHAEFFREYFETHTIDEILKEFFEYAALIQSSPKYYVIPTTAYHIKKPNKKITDFSKIVNLRYLALNGQLNANFMDENELLNLISQNRMVEINSNNAEECINLLKNDSLLMTGFKIITNSNIEKNFSSSFFVVYYAFKKLDLTYQNRVEMKSLSNLFLNVIKKKIQNGLVNYLVTKNNIELFSKKYFSNFPNDISKRLIDTIIKTLEENKKIRTYSPDRYFGFYTLVNIYSLFANKALNLSDINKMVNIYEKVYKKDISEKYDLNQILINGLHITDNIFSILKIIKLWETEIEQPVTIGNVSV